MTDLRLTIHGGHEVEARLREVLAREGFRIVEAPRAGGSSGSGSPGSNDSDGAMRGAA